MIIVELAFHSELQKHLSNKDLLIGVLDYITRKQLLTNLFLTHRFT